jgi:hypothetical protein
LNNLSESNIFTDSGNAKPRHSLRGRGKLPSAVPVRKQTNGDSTITQDSSIEADETLVSTKIYDSESVKNVAEDEESKDSEVASKIIWTPVKSKNDSGTMKEIPMISLNHSEMKNTSTDRISNNQSKVTTMSTISMTMVTTSQEDIGENDNKGIESYSDNNIKH